MKTRKILKSLKNLREKMSVRLNVRMTKIMCTPLKLGVRTYATYANSRTLSVTSLKILLFCSYFKLTLFTPLILYAISKVIISITYLTCHTLW